MNDDDVRLDKWLWAARFFKTRSLAAAAVDGGKVRVNGVRAKPARPVRAGDTLDMAVAEQQWNVVVAALSDRRGPAVEARQLYVETAESAERRRLAAEQRKLAPVPGADRHGRPSKRDARLMRRLGSG
jgi:ribosome-associated heat shock protein Hsp15